MVLLVELLLAAAILAGTYRLATTSGEGMPTVEPDRSPAERADGPLTADELVALRIPAGVGYRKVDVDRLLDRLARQLPRSAYGPDGTDAAPISLDKPSSGEHSDNKYSDNEHSDNKHSLNTEPHRG